MSTQNLTVQITGDASRFSAAVDSALSKLQNFGQQAERAGGILSVAMSAPLAVLGKKMSDAFAESDSLSRGLATLEKDAGTLQARLSKLSDIAKLPGLGFKEAVAGDIRLRTVLESVYGIDGAAKMSERTLRGFGNAVALVGKGKNEFDRALYGVQQLANTKFPLGEDLNIIRDAIPQVTPLLNEAFGTARSEDLKKLGITSKQVMETILNGLDKLPRASGGWKNALENLGDTTDKAMSKVFGSLDSALNLGGMVDKFSGFIEGLADRFANLSPMAQKAIGAFAGLVVIIPPLLAGLGFLTTTILPAITAGLGAILSPIGLVVGAIALAVVAIVKHWDKIKDALVKSGIWENLKTVVNSTLGVIVSIFGVFANLIQGDWTALWDHLKNLFKYIWNGIISMIAGGLKAVNGLFAKAFFSMGMNKIGANFIQASADLDTFINKIKADVPDATKGVANLMNGFNFGGNRTAKVSAGYSPDGKKGKEADTWAERMRKDLKAVDDLIKEFEAKNPGKIDPSLMFMKLQKGWIQDQLGIDERTDLPSSTEIGPVKSAAQRYWKAVAEGWMTPMERAFLALKNNTAKIIGDVNEAINIAAAKGADQKRFKGEYNVIDAAKERLGRLSDLKREVNRLMEGGFIGSGVIDSFGFDQITQAVEEGKMSLSNFEGFAEAFQDTLKMFTEGLKQLGTDVGSSIFEALGTAIGGGKNVMQGLLKSLAGMLASFLSQAGKMMLKAATFLLLSGATNPITFALGLKQAAIGGAMIAGAGVITAMANNIPALAKGGIATAPTLAMIGDNRGAGRGNPEVVSPLNTLKDYIGKPSGGASYPNNVEFVVSGSNLIAVLQMAKEAEYNNR